MATLKLGNLTLEAEFELEFIDGTSVPQVLGSSIRVDKALTTQEAATIAQAIRGLDSTPVQTPHGSGVLSIKSMRWNPTTGVLHTFEGVSVKSWTFAVPEARTQAAQAKPLR